MCGSCAFYRSKVMTFSLSSCLVERPFELMRVYDVTVAMLVCQNKQAAVLFFPWNLNFVFSKYLLLFC